MNGKAAKRIRYAAAAARADEAIRTSGHSVLRFKLWCRDLKRAYLRKPYHRRPPLFGGRLGYVSHSARIAQRRTHL